MGFNRWTHGGECRGLLFAGGSEQPGSHSSCPSVHSVRPYFPKNQLPWPVSCLMLFTTCLIPRCHFWPAEREVVPLQSVIPGGIGWEKATVQVREHTGIWLAGMVTSGQEARIGGRFPPTAAHKMFNCPSALVCLAGAARCARAGHCLPGQPGQAREWLVGWGIIWQYWRTQTGQTCLQLALLKAVCLHFKSYPQGGFYDDNKGMDYHVPVVGGTGTVPTLRVVHVAAEMAPIAKVRGSAAVLRFIGSGPLMQMLSVYLNSSCIWGK